MSCDYLHELHGRHKVALKDVGVITYQSWFWLETNGRPWVLIQGHLMKGGLYRHVG